MRNFNVAGAMALLLVPPAVGAREDSESVSCEWKALGTSAEAYAQPEVIEGGGHATVFDGKQCSRLPQPDGAALRRIGRGSFPLPLTGGGGHAATTGGWWCSRLPPSNALEEVQGGASCFVFRCMFGYFAVRGAASSGLCHFDFQSFA